MKYEVNGETLIDFESSLEIMWDALAMEIRKNSWITIGWPAIGQRVLSMVRIQHENLVSSYSKISNSVGSINHSYPTRGYFYFPRAIPEFSRENMVC